MADIEYQIEYPTHSGNYNYNNNHNLASYEFNNVTFTDFSSYRKQGWEAVSRSVANVGTPNALDRALETADLDRINHVMSMIMVNWNGAKIKHGNIDNGNWKIISSTPEFLEIFQNLCIKAFNNLGKSKTITTGDYKSSKNNKDISVKDVEEIIPILSNLCSDFYELVYEPKKRTTNGVKCVRNSFIMTSPCGQDLTNPNLPFTNILDGEIYNVIYTNDTTTDHTITITNKAALVNLPSGCTIRVPDGEKIEADCPKGGYCELNYMRVGNVIYVRGA